MVNTVKKIFTEKRSLIKFLFFLSFDAILISLAVYLSFLLRFEGEIPPQYFSNIEGMVILSLMVFLPILNVLKLYSFSWLYVSAEELVSLIKATALSFAFLAALLFVLRDYSVFSGFPRSTLFISCFLVILFCGALRFGKRIFILIFQKRKTEGKERTLIAGSGRAGEQILRNIMGSSNSIFYPIGFVDDDPAKKGVLIHGLKVFGGINDIPKIVKKEKIEGLIVALPSAGERTIKGAVEKGREAGLQKIRILPPMDELISGRIRVGIGDLREVEMEDLLGREPVSLDKGSIRKFIRGKRVLVTGAAGSIGSELCRQIIKFDPQYLFLLDQDETGIFNIENELKESFPRVKSFIADIRDEQRLKHIAKHILGDASFDVIFHAAAYKHVPLMEENTEEAVKNNISGTFALTKLALEQKVDKFIFISTDKAVNPTSVMGATKRVGEMICQMSNQQNHTKFISVRFGNVLGSRGSVIPIFKKKIEDFKAGKREPIKITHAEMKRYFMTTPEACLLVMQAAEMGNGGEVFVLDMGDPVKIIDLARNLIKLSGLEPDKDIPIVYTKPRPGEKIIEELLTAEEGTVSTKNKKIFMARLSDSNKMNLEEKISILEEAARKGSKETIIRVLQEAVPTYKQTENHG